MIKVNKLIPEGAKGKFGIMKFDISFDSASHLPVDTYTLNMTTFIIANGSIAKNIQTGIYYEYNNGKWNKTTNIPSDTDNNIITTSGIHTIANNDIGVNRINVDISSAPEPTLIDKTITANGVYNASDDNSDGYSSVDVNVVSDPYFNALKITSSRDSNKRALTSTYLRSSNGIYRKSMYSGYNSDFYYPLILIDPLIEIYNLAVEVSTSQQVIFTPHAQFNYSTAFYCNYNDKPISDWYPQYSGDTITPGDGAVYEIIFEGYFHAAPKVTKLTGTMQCVMYK